MQKQLKSEKPKLRSESWFQHDKVLVTDSFDKVQSLHDKGLFGTIINERLELSLYEALYLLERGKIKVFDKRKKPLTVHGFAKKAREASERFWTRYRVYNDIRSRGYITKAALKYGADFSVYERGTTPSRAHSKWVLFAVSADEVFNWRQFSAMNRVAHSVKKKLLVGVVDSQCDVTYYSIKWTRP